MADTYDVIVVGGGLAGLSAAALLGKAGKHVLLLEKATALGGRARTRDANGYRFNLGPHALYSKGPAARTLRELGVKISGSAPPTRGLYAVRDGELHALPANPWTTLTTRLLGLGGRLELMRRFPALMAFAGRTSAEKTVADYLESFRHDDCRGLFAALIRLSTYCCDTSASALETLKQLRGAVFPGVLYIDRGWSTLVDGLAAVVGAEVRKRAKVEALLREDGRCVGVIVDRTELRAGAVILCGSPSAVVELVGEPLASRVAAMRPVRAACLDLALSSLPKPRNNFALGIDTPTYASVHSAVADLAPAGAATLMGMKYLAHDAEPDAAADRAEIEATVDALQPGWREHLVEATYLPVMLVAGSTVGCEARCDVDAAQLPGCFVAGDWVGPTAMLADAAVASARRAVERIV